MGGPDVVLLHGQPGTGSDWQQVADLLRPQLRVVALDRPGYGGSPLPAGGFRANARAVIAELDAREIERAVLVGHSYGGGVALTAAAAAPDRVAGLVLLASVGPGCLTGWDRLLAAPVAGEVSAFTAFSLTPWAARAGLAALARLRGRPLRRDEYVNWQIWAHARHDRGPLWRTFLAEQRSLVSETAELTAALAGVSQRVLLLADPRDRVVPVRTSRELAAALPDARLRLVEEIGHHLPRRAAPRIAAEILGFLAELDAAPA